MVTRGANIVVSGGVVAGTWSLADDRIVVDWFDDATGAAHDAVAEEAVRLAGILGRPLDRSFGRRSRLTGAVPAPGFSRGGPAD
jgi:hypothetical protein